MPRPGASPEQHTYSYRLFKDGNGPKAIYEALYETYGDKAVSERTLATWIKGFKSLNREVLDMDAPFQWHLMDKYGLPWEAGGFLMDLLCSFVELGPDHFIPNYGLFVTEVPGPDGSEQKVILFSVRDAVWCWRVHLAAPEIGESVGEISDVFNLARGFVVREMARDVLGLPFEVADLEALLVYKPWMDFSRAEERHQAYHTAVERGIVPPVKPPAWTRGDPRVIFLVRHAIAFGYGGVLSISEEHPELLVSQQFELVSAEEPPNKESHEAQA